MRARKRAKIFRSYSARETARFGEDFARKILMQRAAARSALIIALQGDLGAGKTTFTQGFARGLGIKRRIASPTFIIMRRFAIPRGNPSPPSGAFKNFYHVDAYRLRKLDSLEAIGLKEILRDPAGIILIEWPERVKKILQKNVIWLKFQHGKKENERKIHPGSFQPRQQTPERKLGDGSV